MSRGARLDNTVGMTSSAKTVSQERKNGYECAEFSKPWKGIRHPKWIKPVLTCLGLHDLVLQQHFPL